ncbi:hypothetical protein ABEB36_000055 [Hypothenemus hampei]|uniref:Uncharacterized protein n=1 Tax=Hypothenemus hampei TaxID=57062 RepID=A0ABD1FA30_HYPHA
MNMFKMVLITQIVPTFNDWGNCTPMQLKRPLSQTLQEAQKPKNNNESKTELCSSRRRPAISATESVAHSYEKLAKVKKELSELQIAIYKQFEKNLKEVEEELKAQRKRHSELHALEIAIKRAQLASFKNK